MGGPIVCYSMLHYGQPTDNKTHSHCVVAVIRRISQCYPRREQLAWNLNQSKTKTCQLHSGTMCGPDLVHRAGHTPTPDSDSMGEMYSQQRISASRDVFSTSESFFVFVENTTRRALTMCNHCVGVCNKWVPQMTSTKLDFGKI